MTNTAPSEDVRSEQAPSRGETRLGLLAAPAAVTKNVTNLSRLKPAGLSWQAAGATT